jgi:hypothetical protein
VADKARKDLETKSGRKVVTTENYLALSQGEQKKQRSTSAAPKKSSPSTGKKPMEKK